MNVRRILLPVTSLFLSAHLGAADDIVLPEQFLPKLESLLVQASRQSPRMIARALDLEIAENSRIEARAGLLPSAGGWGSFYQSREDRHDGLGFADVDKLYYNVSINQPIFHWGERRNNDRIGAIRLQMSRGNYQEAYRALAQEIRIAYLQLVAQKSYFERVRLAERYQRGILQQAEERLAKNAASESEVFAARVNADRSQLDAERYLVGYETAKQTLARLTGSARIDDADISGAIPEIIYSTTAINQRLASFLSQKEPPTIEVANAARQLEIENLGYLNTKTRLRPKFNFTLGVSQDDQSYTRDIGQRYKVNSYFGGISASWSLFDGFSTGAITRSALARRRQAENTHREAVETATRQAQSQAKQLEFSARSLELAVRLLGSAKGTLATRQADFARGVVSETDVDQSRLVLYDARYTADLARIEYLSTATAFLGVVSTDPVLANLETKQ